MEIFLADYSVENPRLSILAFTSVKIHRNNGPPVFMSLDRWVAESSNCDTTADFTCFQMDVEVFSSTRN
jgi:hypothetical protein